ncbi:hypothetical protein [Nocardioides sp. SYSU D00065]|uniref:hypothetical protein n=1 Tax=Nocardioides sp. SYSU D00065 TaxID=2817378 RepID=UPI001B33CE04|nr:hypothetical protein [Nocardioides sp. SYSU D00065]
MTHDLDAQALAADYGPMLDELRRALDREIGPLTWTPRTDAEEVTRHDGSRALRVGAVNAIGVRTAELEPRRLTGAVNAVLSRHGFREQPAMTGSPSGHLVCESTNGSGAEFTLLVKMAVDAWVDQPL